MARSSLRLLFPVLPLVALACAGCETFSPAQTCDMSAQGNPPIVYTGGGVFGGIYTTSPFEGTKPPVGWPWDGPLLLFQGGEEYTIEHKLGATPAWTQLWIGFTADGAGGGQTIATAVGNEAQIEGMNDKQIKVVNYSCSEYYLLVIAGTPGTTAPAQ